MRFLKKKMSRAEALLKAIEMSDPGDEIFLHTADCTDPNICTCRPTVIFLGGNQSKNPLGFRRR